MEFSTLVQLLRFRAQHSPESLAYTYLKDGLHEHQIFTYAQLDRVARAIAAMLARHEPALTPGDRVLLLYSHGVEFIAAFFGCLYAGMVPIPAPPPDSARFKRTFPRLRAIIEDADARLILSSDAICEAARALEPGSIPWVSSEKAGNDSDNDNDADAEFELADSSGDDLAYLQYTSGSTSSPKGVMLTHACVLRNLALSKKAWSYTEDSVAVTWMPYFHDYGLVDGLLQPLYTGIPCYVLSPLTFIKRPHRWLEAIDRYRGTHTQAPNFAYELCLEKITPAQRDALDLRSLRVASNGAEPLRESTYRRFIEYFAPCGFAAQAYYPSYGLAEATLLVSTKRAGDVLKMHEGAISCGPVLEGMRVAIVDPQSCCRVGDGTDDAVGEIWVSDSCMAVGYWNRPDDSAEIFEARLDDDAHAGKFLRTGDLGFLHDGELYVTGRLKDLIIVDGVNHYPQDIEWTVQQSHPELRMDHCAAFSVDVEGEERLVVVAEANRLLDDWQPVFDAVRQAVSDAHELDLYAFWVLRKGGILKTSSGKLQRQGCKRGFLEETLPVAVRWSREESIAPVAAVASAVAAMSVMPIARWLIEALAARLHISADSIDPRAPFSSYGLTSRSGVGLVGDLEQWLGRDDLPPTLLWQYPNIAALSVYLVDEPGTAAISDAISDIKRISHHNCPVAIIGIACRLPGVRNTDEFWQLLTSKGDTLHTLPAERWQGSGVKVAEGNAPGCVTTLRGGFFDTVDRFDADLFGINAREAEVMDPQQRMLLEVAWETFENAGLAAENFAGSQTGVYVGISTDDYSAWQFADPDNISAYTGTAKALSIAANRISYQFDLLGPSMAIDTACSSSLVAIHQASQALRNGECSMALAGGVNLILAPQMSIALSQAGMLAPDGRCKTFDAAADGYVRGEGCILMMLKRLDDALRDGDTIAAVIKGSAVNQDGRSNGLTAPNGLAQQRVVRQALADAGVEGKDIGYVETHGTGTALGDPIEVQSLQAVLMPGRAPGQRCALGALKANTGHLEAAAGAAGLLKAILCLQHGEITPQPALNPNQLNPLLNLKSSAFFVPTESTPWDDEQRLASVSAFGFGGTNAHIIIAPHNSPLARYAGEGPGERACHALTLSAHNQEALRALATQWQTRLATNSAINPASIADQCFSANTTRTRLPERLALIAPDANGLRKALTHWLENRPGAWHRGTAHAQYKPRIGFLFTGQGSQYLGMGHDLYRTQPGFRNDIDACDALLRESLDHQSLVKLMYPQEGQGHAHAYAADNMEIAEAKLARTDLTQPALFALEYALARLWMSWGVQPAAMLGHSIGEYVAAVIAGVLTLEDGLRLVAARARAMHEAPGDGGMVAVTADAEQCEAALAGWEDKVAIAAYNGPRNHVLSGDRAALEAVVERLTAQGINVRALRVSHAFHSPLMQTAAQELANAAAGVTFHPPRIPVYSNVSGGVLGGDDDYWSAYWVEHLLKPVHFAQGIRAMHADGIDTLIEIGPRPVLLALAQESLGELLGDAEMLCLPSLRPQASGRQLSDSQSMFDGLAALHVRGLPVDWRGFDQHWPRRRVALPLYPFQGPRYWLPAVKNGNEKGNIEKWISSPLLDHMLYEARYDCATLPLLGEHRVFGQVVVPGAAHLSLVLEAAGRIAGDKPCALQDVIFPQALTIPEAGSRRVQLAVARQAGKDGRAFKLISFADNIEEAWEEHAAGRLVEMDATTIPAAVALEKRAGSTGFYQDVWQPAIELGPQFRWVSEVWHGAGEVWARLSLPEQARGHGYRLHPGLIDSMLQVLTAAAEVKKDEALVPFSFEQFCWLRPLQGDETWSHVRLRPQTSGNEVVSDVDLHDAEGRLVAQARGFRARRVASRDLMPAKSSSLERAVYALQWEAMPANMAEVAVTGTCVLIGGQMETLARNLEEKAKGLRCVCASSIETIDSIEQADTVIYLTPAGTTLETCTRVMQVTQAILRMPAPAPRLILLTAEIAHIDQAAVWGMAKVIQLEHPELACHCVDVRNGDDAASALLAALRIREDFILRDGQILTPLLTHKKPAATEPVRMRADVRYLITGGLGALGLRLAEWLVERGARSLVLLGRRVPSESAQQRIDLLRQAGIDVHTAALDVADAAALAAVVQQEHALPVGGVFHLAGVLDDGMLQQQDSARLAAVLAPKLDGALHLHRLFQDQDHALDYFVCFSSVAALTGSMGQSTYAAANAALDALMTERHAAGLPGLSIQWGPWAESGMAAVQSERDRQRFAGYGIEPIGLDAGMALLGSLLQETSPVQAVLPVHWPAYLSQLFGAHPPAMYRAMQAADTPRKNDSAAVDSFADQLIVADPAARRGLLERRLHEIVAGVLRLAGKQSIGPRQRLFELGLDSLGAVELRNRLAAALGRNMRATLLFDFPTLTALADHIEHDVLGFPAPGAEEKPAAAETENSERYAQFSEQELANLLAAELN